MKRALNLLVLTVVLTSCSGSSQSSLSTEAAVETTEVSVTSTTLPIEEVEIPDVSPLSAVETKQMDTMRLLCSEIRNSHQIVIENSTKPVLMQALLTFTVDNIERYFNALTPIAETNQLTSGTVLGGLVFWAPFYHKEVSILAGFESGASNLALRQEDIYFKNIEGYCRVAGI